MVAAVAVVATVGTGDWSAGEVVSASQNGLQWAQQLAVDAKGTPEAKGAVLSIVVVVESLRVCRW